MKIWKTEKKIEKIKDYYLNELAKRLDHHEWIDLKNIEKSSINYIKKTNKLKKLIIKIEELQIAIENFKY